MSDESIAWAFTLGVQDHLEHGAGIEYRGGYPTNINPFRTGTMHAKLWKAGYAA